MVSLGLPPVAPITLILLGAAVGLVSTSGPVITAASVAPPLQTTGHHVSDATATVPCTFNESLHGLECFGLSLHGAASSAAECSAACCALGAKCSSWQFCGDFTTYCGAEHGGCYIGDISHEGCHWQSGCEAEACWDGGCRGGTCPTIGPAPPPAPPPPAQCGSAGLPPCLVDLEEVGLQFDGVGGITSNGECRCVLVQSSCRVGSSPRTACPLNPWMGDSLDLCMPWGILACPLFGCRLLTRQFILSPTGAPSLF